MSKRTRRKREGAKAQTSSNKRVNSERENALWRFVTNYPDIFDTHVVTKLNGNDVKFFYDVNSESRAAMKRAGAQVPDAFKIRDFSTKLTLTWALVTCSENKERFCTEMARNGNFVLLKFLHEKGCPWDYRTCSEAAKNGHLECLKYAHENGCPWDHRTTNSAAEHGHLECLKYAHENGCPWGPLGIWNSDTRSNEDACSLAAMNGHLECLKYAHEKGCPWNEETCSNAAQSGDLECLKYAHENGCPWDRNTCSWAASHGHLECLKYAHENGCPWDETTCKYAAQNGHLRCLQYAHENGCRGSANYAHLLPPPRE